MGEGERLIPAGSPAGAPAVSGGVPGAQSRCFRVLLIYEGTRFHGWQVQPRLVTVQGEVERAILAVTGQILRIQGAGRTDAGVHALGQVASFRLQTRLAPERLRMALNAHLPPEIRVLRVEEVAEDFSARFSACWRHYRYVLARTQSPFLRERAHVPRTWPDRERMNAACAALLGEHEFRSFTTQPDGPFGCRVAEAGWTDWAGGLVFSIRSNRFLYQMVRILVGTALEIGRGRLAPEAAVRILADQDRRSAGPLAPACGLYLVGVGYDPPWPEPPVTGLAVWPALG